MEISESWRAAKGLISSGADIRDIKDALSKLSETEIEDTYEEDLNLLHLAIENDRVDVVKSLAEKFLDPDSNPTIPYLHMACVLDRAACISGYLERVRMQEYDPLRVKVETDNLHWKQFVDAHPVEGIENEELHKQVKFLLASKKSISAYEVAALYQRKECLERLLKAYPKNEVLEEMVQIDQPAVLHTLLETTDVDFHAVNYAFEVSLVLKSPVCLKMIIRYGEKQNITFLQKNPYFFMYRNGVTPGDELALESTQGDTLAECTEILIQHGFDVNVMARPASYALYQLFEYHALTHDAMNYERVSMDDRFTCLSLLLEAGADPNFDESSVEFDVERFTTFGSSCYGAVTSFEAELMIGTGDEIPVNRPPQTSAAYGLAKMFRSELDAEVFRFIIKAVPLLDRYGCNMSYVDSDGNTVLHHALCGLADSIGGVNIREDEIPIMALAIGTLLSFGANMNIKNKENNPPLASFTKRLVESIMEQAEWLDVDDEEMWEQLSQYVTPLYNLMLVMDVNACSEVNVKCQEIIASAPTINNIPELVKTGLKELIQSNFSHVSRRSLYETCLIKVWHYSGQKVTNLENLGLPIPVQQDLTTLFTSFLNNF